MNARSQLLERPGDDRRLALTVVVALGLHLSLLFASFSPREARVALAPAAPRNEVDVRVQDEAAPGAPGGGAAAEDADEDVRPMPAAPHRAVIAKAKPAPAKPAPRDVVRAEQNDAAPDRVPAPVAPAASAQPAAEATAPVARPMPAPSNSRDPEWRRSQMGIGAGRGPGEGRGSGRGGLFGNGSGNGRVVGDGPGALEVRVCFIPESTRFVREVERCDAIYQQFIDEIDVPPRRFEAGFPGFEGRTEWFGVMIQGVFVVPDSGRYQFRLKADDGALLFIDGQLVVDNDGIHGAVSKRGTISLREGRHRIVLRYFQGMKYELALQLFVTPPGEAERLFRSGL